MIIFYLYSKTKLLKSFDKLASAVSYIKDNENNDLELYVEEYDDDNAMSHGIKTLLFRHNNFQIKNIFDYY
mgnify:CR=1 FL=1